MLPCDFEEEGEFLPGSVPTFKIISGSNSGGNDGGVPRDIAKSGPGVVGDSRRSSSGISGQGAAEAAGEAAGEALGDAAGDTADGEAGFRDSVAALDERRRAKEAHPGKFRNLIPRSLR